MRAGLNLHICYRTTLPPAHCPDLHSLCGKLCYKRYRGEDHLLAGKSRISHRHSLSEERRVKIITFFANTGFLGEIC